MLSEQILAGRRDGEELIDFRERKVRADFAEERTVVVDGWILVPTECRFFALMVA